MTRKFACLVVKALIKWPSFSKTYPCCKQEFFLNIASELEPFLKEFQGNQPLVPLLYDRLQVILRSLLNRFIKADVVQGLKSGVALIKADVKQDCVVVKEVDIGFGARRALAGLSTEVNVNFRKEAKEILQSICSKIQERSRLKYSLIKYVGCSNPQIIWTQPEECHED